MMNTTLASCFVALALLSGLPTASSPSAREDDRAEVLILQSDRGTADTDYPSELRFVPLDGSASFVRHSHDMEFRTPADWSPDSTLVLAVLARKSGANQFDLVSVAHGSARVLKTLLPAGSEDAAKTTVLAGMPWWIWCKLLPRACYS